MRWAVAFGCVAFAWGCAAGPVTTKARPAAKKTDAAAASAKGAASAKDEPSRVAAAPDWESFSQTAAALRSDISRRAGELRHGPVGNRAQQLASLRLASNARDLIDAGSLEGALEALQRAVSLYGGNGYAYLWLAYVHHVQGRADRAAEFAASARRYLPADTKIRAELEGLALSIRHGSAQAAS